MNAPQSTGAMLHYIITLYYSDILNNSDKNIAKEGNLIIQTDYLMQVFHNQIAAWPIIKLLPSSRLIDLLLPGTDYQATKREDELIKRGSTYQD